MADEQEGSLDLEINQICVFLEKRGLTEDTISRFRHEKMDFCAVYAATDEQLRELGILRRGDLLSLKGFVSEKYKGETRDEKKRKLLNLLQDKSYKKTKKARKDDTVSEAKKSAKVTRKIQLGWLHFDIHQNKYVAVRTSKGGGTRAVSVELQSNIQDIIHLAKSVFFPSGKSCLGKWTDMIANIGNFKCEEIIGDLTLTHYITSNALTKVRVYLMTKLVQNEIPGKTCLVLDSHDDEFPAVFATDDNIRGEKDESNIAVANKRKLKGTSVERNAIRIQQDNEYEESLAADKAKAQEKKEIEEKEIQKKEIQKKKVEKDSKRCLLLQTVRKERTPPVPSEDEECAIVSVRHITLGLQRRTFKSTDTLSAVYDWIGSLSSKPESFALSGVGLPQLLPSLPVTVVDQAILNMKETNTMLTYPEDDLNFIGFGEDDLISHNVGAIDDTLPEIFMQVDLEIQDLGEVSGEEQVRNNSTPSIECLASSSTQASSPSQASPTPARVNRNDSRSLQNDDDSDGSDLIEDVTGGATSKKSISVHRATLKSDLIQIFSSSELMDVELNVTVIDHHGRYELGAGIGVLRDVLATFWQDIFASLTQGNIEKVPSIRHDYQQQEWKSIGRILLYGFRHLGYVPVCLSPVFLASCIHGEETITEDDLLESFKWYITADEREVFDHCMTDQSIDFVCDDDLMDFLSSYRCFRKPTAQTIRRILTELAHQEIIQKPRYVATCWTPVLGVLKELNCFANIESIRKLFQDSKPTAKKVIKALEANPTTDAEKESFAFLKKFIRSLDAVSLKVFLKFLTGSDVMTVKTISVTFSSLDGLGRTPVARTCGPSLELPCTYQSYNELSEEFNSILREKESWTFNIV